MTRGFTEQEKEYIYNLLLEKGKEYFSVHGLKKTGIKDLTEAAGIAQGSFYLFFSSKEELYFRILEQEEETIKNELSTSLVLPLTAEKLSVFLVKGIFLIQENPFIRRLYFEGEMELLIRKLPKNLAEEYIKIDEDALLTMLSSLDLSFSKEELETISGAIRAFFLISLHKKEIGEEMYEETVIFLAKAISNQVFERVKS